MKYLEFKSTNKLGKVKLFTKLILFYLT